MKKEGLFVIGIAIAFAAYAGGIKVWNGSEAVVYTGLNSNFAHIHNTMVGGHGARLVNADVSTSAAIAHSKMATPALLPKAWAAVDASCSSSPCTVAEGSGVTSIARTGQGVYTVTLSYTPTNSKFAVMVTADSSLKLYCKSINHATAAPHTEITCYDETGAVQDTGFQFVVMDT